jgi:Asp-tRNA(Asn)/Glu-tRNA(Gln) amidotransferase A subunit family amidase
LDNDQFKYIFWEINSDDMIFKTILVTVLYVGIFSFISAQQAFTTEDIHAAGRLMGLQFDNQEIDSLYPNLQEYLEDYNSNRNIKINNSIPPAVYFNPFPNGYAVSDRKQIIEFQQDPIERPDDINDIAYYSISELGHLIKTRQISSVELTEFYLQRLIKYDKTLHCVITYTEDRALKQARAMDAEIASGRYRGPLHGIPYGIKDLFATKGYKTTWGAMPYKDQILDMDAAVVEKLDEAGAVLIAKLTLGALAWGDVWYGEKTRNPWDPTRGSSGSSAGPAAAVSAGLVPFALGTETLGSIVSPSTVCGTTGLRPTFGRVSRYGAMALSWSMDKVGPICRSAEDCAMVFDAIRGKDIRDKSTIEAPFSYSRTSAIDTLTIGYLPAMFDGDYAFKSQDSTALEVLRSLGFELRLVDLPDYPSLNFLLGVEAAAAFDDLTRSGDDDLLVRQIRNAWPNTFRAARFVPAVEYVQAMRLRTMLIEEMAGLFNDVDVIAHPSWASSMLSITNMTGHPTVVVPNGFRDERPTSISFTGRLFEEGVVLRLAQMYQDTTGWDEMHPVE